jgi:hypothetical protein
MPESTVFPKGPDALTNGDRLRMDSLTGQDKDPKAPRAPWHWIGYVDPPVIVAGPREEEILRSVDPY